MKKAEKIELLENTIKLIEHLLGSAYISDGMELDNLHTYVIQIKLKLEELKQEIENNGQKEERNNR